LVEILHYHQQHGKEGTILGKKIPSNEAHKFGCLAIDPKTNEVLHYAEKPETFVSDIINCGIYLFSPSIYKLIDEASAHIAHDLDQDPDFLRLEQDLLMKICGEKHVYVYETSDFWLQIKSASIVVKCSENLLAQLRRTNPVQLAKSSPNGPTIVGDVLIHPTAKVHPTAKLGPNVSIGPGVVIGAGVRCCHAIVLGGCEIKAHACILHSIIGWNSVIGQWARLEGVPTNTFSSTDDVRSGGLTILGAEVTVAAEVIIHSSIVLPHKDLNGNYHNQILL